MRKYLALFVVIFGLAVYVSVQDERATQQSIQTPAQLANGTASAKAGEKQPQENRPDTGRFKRICFSFFRWPNGTTAWAIIFTLLAIAEQTKETRKATEATQIAVCMAGKSLILQEDTAKRQLRAYFGAVGGKLYIYDDGTVEPRVTFNNCGQTPAYDLQVIECGRFDTHPFKKVPAPDQGMLPPHAHVIGGGHPYYFTCRKVPYSQGKESLLLDLSSARYAFILNGWCTYRDIFKETHPVSFQLIIGGGTPLQRTVDQTGEWFGFFTDSEGNSYD